MAVRSNISVENYNKFIDIIIKEIELEATAITQKNIKKVGAYASGNLLNSITSEVKKNSNTQAFIRIGSDTHAAVAAEIGFPPGVWVPVFKIYQWMIDKGMTASVDGAYAIQRKIYEEGYEGRHPFEKSEEELASKIEDIVARVINNQDIV